MNAEVPHSHWKMLTFPGAQRINRIDTPCVFDGPINGYNVFPAQILAGPILSNRAFRKPGLWKSSTDEPERMRRLNLNQPADNIVP